MLLRLNCRQHSNCILGQCLLILVEREAEAANVNPPSPSVVHLQYRVLSNATTELLVNVWHDQWT